MSTKMDALIVRVTKVGEADRFITALTKEHGLIRASAKGSQKVKSKNSAGTSLLAFSHLSLVESHEKYIVTEAQPERLFYSFDSNVYCLSLAQYFCELATALCPWDEEAETQQRLLLNGLHFLTEGKKDHRLLKAIIELRLLAEAGYMPNMSGCSICGQSNGSMAFSPVKGCLFCEQCDRDKQSIVLLPSTLDAMRYILSSPVDRIFQFSVGEEALHQLSHVTESFLLCQLNRGFKTLDFYHSIKE